MDHTTYILISGNPALNRILISVVNYCDPEFYSTIESVWKNAKYKENLYFSLVSEDTVRYSFDFIPEDQLLYRHFDISEYRGGLGWARNLALKTNFDYDFLMQFDSHTYTNNDWDEEALSIYNLVGSKYKEKFLIAHAPANYEYLKDGQIDFVVYPEWSMKATKYDHLIPGFNFPEYSVMRPGDIFKTHWATCCYLFAPKKWVEEVGISKECSFNTEEISLSIRTFAKEWSIYSVGTRNVFHHMSHKQPDGSVTRSGKRPWADGRKEDYWSHVKRASDNLSKLMSGNLDIEKEKVEKFFEETGISKKYLEYIDRYDEHVVIDNRGFGMPPRRDFS